jgi:hypothetical protein
MEQTPQGTPGSTQGASGDQQGQYCGQCGAPNPAGSRFCAQCGQPLTPAAFGGSGDYAGTTGGQHTEIYIPHPNVPEHHLRISAGACRLILRRGNALAWVTGTYDDPTGSLPCRVIQEGGAVRITQKPQFAGLQGWGRGVPTFDLALGTGQAYGLTVETGASENTFELSGLPLTRLVLKLGAGKNTVRFMEPNPQAMSVLDFDAGAGSMELYGLANANFAAMMLDGGAAAFICDFGGTLQRDASVHISTGLATVELRVPATTAARIIPESTLGHIDAGNGFAAREGGYWTAPALEGARPALTIQANVALGSLRLQTT